MTAASSERPTNNSNIYFPYNFDFFVFFFSPHGHKKLVWKAV